MSRFRFRRIDKLRACANIRKAHGGREVWSNMSFFIRNNKRPRQTKKTGANNFKSKYQQKNNKKPIQDLNEEIPSDPEYSDEEVSKNRDADLSSEEEETTQEKRLRLAKQYLEEIEKEEKRRLEAAEVDKDVIAHRLKEDVLEQAGKLQKKIADQLLSVDEDAIKVLRGHKLSITCLVISPDDKYVYSGSKDCSIIKWCIESCRKIKVIPGVRKGKEKHQKGHGNHILSIAVSSDNKFLASGCRNKVIHIWDPETLEHIHTFQGHRDAISGLTFRKGSHQLYSASFDRSVKIWNLDEMAYVETLFGHQDTITSIDSLSRERAVTSGGRDNSVRIWKIVEESQLVYHGHLGSIDCVRLINEEYFVSCGDDGTIALWGVLKKKPHSTIPSAHGLNADNGLPNWVTSVAALQNSDLVASGSSDGNIKLWKCGEAFRSITSLMSVPTVGFINYLQFANNGRFLVAGIGQEHRLGRWWSLKQARNSIVIIPLKT